MVGFGRFLNDWEEFPRSPIIKNALFKMIMFALNLVKCLMYIGWMKVFLY